MYFKLRTFLCIFFALNLLTLYSSSHFSIQPISINYQVMKIKRDQIKLYYKLKEVRDLD